MGFPISSDVLGQANPPKFTALGEPIEPIEPPRPPVSNAEPSKGTRSTSRCCRDVGHRCSRGAWKPKLDTFTKFICKYKSSPKSKSKYL